MLSVKLSEGSHYMKMCLKLGYCALSLSPSVDATMCTFWGFSSLFVEVETFWWVFSLPKLDCGKSLCEVASVFVCVHPLNKDVSQAITGTFFQCLLLLSFLDESCNKFDNNMLIRGDMNFKISWDSSESILLVLVNSALLISSMIISYSNSIACWDVETMSLTWWSQACQTKECVRSDKSWWGGDI